MPTAAAVVICHVTSEQPAGFIANFTGATGAALDNTASGRITENKFTSPESNNYDDEAVLVFEAPAGSAPTLRLPQELQSTGADLFTPLIQTGLQPAPGMDSHRLESIEVLLRRGTGIHPGTATMTVTPATSHVLDLQGGTIGTAYTLPGLNSAPPVKAVVGTAVTGRFFGFRLTGTNANSVFQFLGAILRGRRLT